MKKLLILLFMSLSLTVQSSSGPDWFDAPLEACFKAAEEGSFVGKGSGKVWIKFLDYDIKSECNFAFRNYIYDEKEFSLMRALEDCSFPNKGFAFCEYAEFNSDSSVKVINNFNSN